MRRLVFSAGVLLGALAALAGCGDGLAGTYVPDGFAIVQKVELKAGKAYVTVLGTTKEGTYTVDGDKVSINVAGDATVFTRDAKGCLDGGPLAGRLCRSPG
jgi:hypothetical protein